MLPNVPAGSRRAVYLLIRFFTTKTDRPHPNWLSEEARMAG